MVVKTTRAKRAWLRYLAECFWEVDTHLQAGVITKLAQTVRTEESGLLYFQRILNHTYGRTDLLLVTTECMLTIFKTKPQT